MKQLTPAQVFVDDSQYERTHGKAPRGRGHWMFCTVRPGSEGYLDHLIPRDQLADDTYTAQKKAAQRWAAGAGLRTVWVCD